MESSQAALAPLAGPPAPPPEPPRETNDWPWWTAPAALVGGLLLAAVGGLAVDIPASLFGVSITASHLPGWLELLDTMVQDGAFVGAAVLFAHVGRRTVRAWQFGLRPPRLRWRSTALLIFALLLAFLIFSAIWSEVIEVHTKEKLLEQLGANEGTSLLLLSALLTCVIAPFCEEFLFRGFIYTALCSWRGPWPAAIITGLVFGGIHAGSAPAADLLPLGALGFGLCLLYRRTGSLYPCIAAHSLNNSLAFGALESWGWQIPVLMAAALATIALLIFALKRAGVITPPPESRVPPVVLAPI
ncbi:MAG TPA: CPBP family intramembrane glutamic endopeptidase [Solirubrobacteraceae bacterium]|jgi:membrane protease YdiL (CAAX protease family)|nr:CPBP family intramembrane glutamic endopeptidase [Solirubrobacteraceae bacterium]